MKKSLIFAVAITLCGAAAAFSQTTTKSTDGGSKASKDQPATPGTLAQNTPAGAQKRQKSTPQPASANAHGEQAQKTSEADGSNRPGGELHKNANDVGSYSADKNEKSMTHSKKALAQRNKNLTEQDTVLKKGSGSAPKNTKNHTGKTGNYNNADAKQNQKPGARD
jgi:hypothetical protein